MKRFLSRRAFTLTAGTGAGSFAAGMATQAQEQRGNELTLTSGAIPRTLTDKLAESLSIADFGARPDARDNKSAIERAIQWALKSGRCVTVPPGTYAYSQLDFRRNDDAVPTRLILAGPGTLQSQFRGPSIVASAGEFYDLVIEGVRFESRAGAGTTLIDGDRFRRLIFTPGSQISGFDWVIRGRQYLQSVRLLGTIIRGGRGAVIQAPMAYDCTFSHNIIEFVTDGIVINGPNDPAAHTCRIEDNVIEGIGGRAIVLGSCLATTVSGNYLENNALADIRLDAGLAPHKGLKVQDNSIQMSPSRAARREYGIVWGRSTSLPARAGGNFCTGPLHDTTGVTAVIDMLGDYSQVELYKGYQPEDVTGRQPIGRAAYSDGLAHHFSWFDRYLTLDPHQNEIRFGGRHRSSVGDKSEPPAVTFGIGPPDQIPSGFDRKRWARGSVVFNAEPAPGRPFAWVCQKAGEPGNWSGIPSS